ncbi:MAG: G-D-S-L family lipolytic protein, partial [Bacteroidota bacterium]
NKAIKKIAEEEELIYLDIHRKLIDKNGLLAEKFTADGVHINGEAYLIWKSLVLPFIEKL